jgi:hypothetical protein
MEISRVAGRWAEGNTELPQCKKKIFAVMPVEESDEMSPDWASKALKP